jgi:hypothetical protein
MSSPVTRFLGDTPLRVFFRLLVLSFIVGLVLSALNLHPFEIFRFLERWIARMWSLGFEAFGDALQYLLLGAVIVVPLFLLSRLLKAGRRPED